MDNEIESMPVNDSTDIVFDEDTIVSKSLQDILKIADEATKDDCPYSSVELIPITDSEQTINNIVEEERAKDDTDKAKVATEESAELVTEEKSNSKLEEQKEEIEDVHTSVRRIEKIFDTETEKEIDAEEFFARPESELIKWREEFERCIKFSEKRFLCPFCRQQIKIAGRKFERGHISFFTHLHDSADCPIKTSVNMSKEEIEARKYGLCQESKRHKKLKQWIYDGLNGEQSKQQGVDNIKIEQRINANIPYFNWRRPDICATFKALNVVFELQLSTTFLSTIVDRDIFYRLHHYFIIWIFNFEENVKYVDLSNLMMKDIYYTNKRNIFVFDREAREVSEKRKELVLKCNWLTPENKWKYPVTKNGDGLDVSGKLITLSDLTFDETSGKVYYVDAEEEYYCAHPDARKIEKRIENDRKQLLERWMAHVKRNNDVPDEQEMMELVSQMVAKAERAVIYKVNNRMGLMYNFRHLTAPQYSSIEALGDYFLAKYNRKTALYDQYGRQILPCEYLNIYQRENGLIFAESTSTWSLLFDDKIEKLCDRNPHDKITIQNEGIRLRITIKHPYNGSETGYVLTDGINIIPFIYQSTKICKDGEHIIVCRNSLYGIYSKDLRLIIPIDYKSITPIENSQKCVAVNQDNAICLINLADATQQVLPYEQLRFNGGNFIVRQQGKEGVVDTNNTVIVPIAYQQCTATANNYFKVKTIRDNAAEYYGLYDCHGKQILQSQFNRIDYIGDDGSKQMIVVGRLAEMRIVDPNTKMVLTSANIPYGSKLFFNNGEAVKKGDIICEWDPFNAVIISEATGKVAFENVEEGVSYRVESDETTGLREKIIIESKDRTRVPAAVVLDDNGEVLRSYSLPVGAHLMIEEGYKLRAGEVFVKIPRAQGKAGDITGGLPRVTELFEARNPSNPAIVSEIDGEVHFGSIKRGNREISVRSKTGEETKYLVPLSKQILVQENDYVRAGTPLSDGAITPADILAIKGPTAVQEYIVNEVQDVYRMQGVKINDKHFEVIVRQMMRKVNILDPGDTRFLEQQVVDKREFMDENDRIWGKKVVTDAGDSQNLKAGQIVTARRLRDENSSLKRRDLRPVEVRDAIPATSEQILQGITRAALQTSSFMSAASFQETTKVLNEAAILGKADYLEGMKENVICGHLIPAGTGLREYDRLIVGSKEDFERSMANRKTVTDF